MLQFISVQSLSRSVVSDSLRPHELQHARPPLSITNSWSLPKLMSIESVMPSRHLILCCPPILCPQSLPASESFQMNQLFASGGQNTGVSALTSVLPTNTQDWSPLGCTGWISLQSKGLPESSPTPQFKSINFPALSPLYNPTLISIHEYWKNQVFYSLTDFLSTCFCQLLTEIRSIL